VHPSNEVVVLSSRLSELSSPFLPRSGPIRRVSRPNANQSLAARDASQPIVSCEPDRHIRGIDESFSGRGHCG
jgi:hypothetical protein